jgi:hypothetical protein
MAVLGKFFQTPTEKKQYTLDYSNWLQPGESISGAPTFVAVPPSGYVPVAPVVFAATVNPPFNAIIVFISGGDDGISYKCLVTITTSSGQIKEDEFYLNVKAP